MKIKCIKRSTIRKVMVGEGDKKIRPRQKKSKKKSWKVKNSKQKHHLDFTIATSDRPLNKMKAS